MSLAAEIAAAPATNAAAAANAANANGVTVSEPAAAAAAANAQPAAAAVTRFTVPEEYRTQDAVRKFMDDKFTLDPAVLLKSHVHLEGKLGSDKIPVPKSDDDWKEVYAKLGCPAEPTAYEVQRPEKLADGTTYNEEGEKSLRNWAHANGLNQKQFSSAYSAFMEHVNAQNAEIARINKEARDTGEATLKREQGQAYDGFVSTAKAAAAKYLEPQVIAKLEQAGLANDPDILRMFNRVGKDMMGDTQLRPTNGAAAASTPAEIQMKIDKMYAERSKELFNAEHPDHALYAKQLEALFKEKHAVA